MTHRASVRFEEGLNRYSNRVNESRRLEEVEGRACTEGVEAAVWFHCFMTGGSRLSDLLPLCRLELLIGLIRDFMGTVIENTSQGGWKKSREGLVLKGMKPLFGFIVNLRGVILHKVRISIWERLKDRNVKVMKPLTGYVRDFEGLYYRT